jgi:hypothetical protein
MTERRISITRRPGRRLLALFVFGWLNLVLQPCLAGTAMGAMDATAPGHCAQLPGAPDADRCISMMVQDCVQAGGLQGDALPRSGDDHRLIAPAGFPPAAAAWPSGHLPIVPSRHLRPASDPPFTIRFCTLRN